MRAIDVSATRRESAFPDALRDLGPDRAQRARLGAGAGPRHGAGAVALDVQPGAGSRRGAADGVSRHPGAAGAGHHLRAGRHLNLVHGRHIHVPARWLVPPDRQYVVPLHLRQQRRGLHGPHPLRDLLPAVRPRGGVMGAYILLYPKVRVHILIVFGFYITTIAVPAMFMLGYWFLIQLISGFSTIGSQGGGVAFWAHVGGFVAGGLLVLAFRDRRLVDRHPNHGWRPRG